MSRMSYMAGLSCVFVSFNLRWTLTWGANGEITCDVSGSRTCNTSMIENWRHGRGVFKFCFFPSRFPSDRSKGVSSSNFWDAGSENMSAVLRERICSQVRFYSRIDKRVEHSGSVTDNHNNMMLCTWLIPSLTHLEADHYTVILIAVIYTYQWWVL